MQIWFGQKFIYFYAQNFSKVYIYSFSAIANLSITITSLFTLKKFCGKQTYKVRDLNGSKMAPIQNGLKGHLGTKDEPLHIKNLTHIN